MSANVWQWQNIGEVGHLSCRLCISLISAPVYVNIRWGGDSNNDLNDHSHYSNFSHSDIKMLEKAVYIRTHMWLAKPAYSSWTFLIINKSVKVTKDTTSLTHGCYHIITNHKNKSEWKEAMERGLQEEPVEYAVLNAFSSTHSIWSIYWGEPNAP